MANTLVDHVQDYLVERGIVRPVDQDGTGARPWPPPFWRNPKPGVPAPLEKGRSKSGAAINSEADDGLVVAGLAVGRIPAAPGEGYSRWQRVDLHLRATYYPPIEAIADQLEDEFAPAQGPAVGTGSPGARYNWTMAGLLVIESRGWQGLAPLDASEAQGYHYRIGFLFETLR